LISQGKRAVVSIALQISEGSGRKTNKDFSLFINRALASLQEVDGVLKIGIALEYITYEDYELAELLLKEEYFKLIAFNKRLNQNPNKYRGYSAKPEEKH
jgi:four helix bundle protein